MTGDAGPANLAFDFAKKGDEPPDEPLSGDLTGPPGAASSPKLLLNVGEVGEALGCGKTRVYELIARGDLPTVKMGRQTRIPTVALAEFLCRKLRSNPSNLQLAQPPHAPSSERGARRKREPRGTDPPLARRDSRRR